MDERAAPVVTIVDPSRPQAQGDLLLSGDEKPPWRPKRWLYQAVALWVLLAVAAITPDLVVSKVATDRRAGIASDEGVRLSVASGGDGTTTALPVVVSNDGPSPVTVLDLTVLLPGQLAQRVSRRVGGRNSTPVTLPDTLTCSEKLVTGALSGLARVRVRTSSGHEVTRQVVLDRDLWANLRGLAQKRCGYLPADQAFETTVDLTRSGDTLELHLAVTNLGRLPLTVNSFGATAPGLAVSQSAPVLVPGLSTRPVPLVLRISIENCQDLAQFGGGISVELGVAVRLSHGSEQGANIQLTESHPEITGAISRLIRQRCGRAR